MNQQVLTNLAKMIGEIDKDDESEAADAGPARCRGFRARHG